MSAPAMVDLDLRLQAGASASRALLLAVIEDHHVGAAPRCPGCGWRPPRKGRGCPSAVVAAALRERKSLPAWLAHLVVPGLPSPRASREELQLQEDALPGLFPAPERRRVIRQSTTSMGVQ